MLTLRNVDIVMAGYMRCAGCPSCSMGEIVALVVPTARARPRCSLPFPASCAFPAATPGDGHLVASEKPERIVRLGLSHVPERRLVFGPMSVADGNLLLRAYLKFRRRHWWLLIWTKSTPCFRYCATATTSRRRPCPAANSKCWPWPGAHGRLHLLLDEPGMGLAPQICKEIFRHVVTLRRDKGADRALKSSKTPRAPWPWPTGAMCWRQAGAPFRHLRRTARQPRRPPCLPWARKDN